MYVIDQFLTVESKWVFYIESAHILLMLIRILGFFFSVKNTFPVVLDQRQLLS